MSAITPKGYFFTLFRDDFYLFIRGAAVHERDGYLYIPIQNLSKARLSHIPEWRVPMFYFALADLDVSQGRAGTIFVSVLKEHTLN